MKQIDKLDKYVVAPNVGFYGGYRYIGEDVILCNDHDEDAGQDFMVKQRIENGVLITDLERIYERQNGKKVSENSHQEVELEENQLLVYVEGTGFVIPEYKMCLIEEAVEQYNILKG